MQSKFLSVSSPSSFPPSLPASVYINFKKPVNCFALSVSRKIAVVSGTGFIARVGLLPFGLLQCVEADYDIWKIEFSASELFVYLASNESDSLIHIHHSESLARLGAISGHGGFLSEILVLRTRDVVVSSSSDRTIRIWDGFGYGEREQISEASVWFRALACDAQETRFFAGGGSRDLISFSILPFKLTRKRSLPEAVFSLRFSGDGRTLFAGLEVSVGFLDPQNLALIRRIPAFLDLVRAVAPFYGDKFLVGSSEDDSISAFAFGKGASVYTFERHQDRVFNALVTPEGYLLSASQDRHFSIAKTRLTDPKLTLDVEHMPLLALKGKYSLSQLKMKKLKRVNPLFDPLAPLRSPLSNHPLFV